MNLRFTLMQKKQPFDSAQGPPFFTETSFLLLISNARGLAPFSLFKRTLQADAIGKEAVCKGAEQTILFLKTTNVLFLKPFF